MTTLHLGVIDVPYVEGETKPKQRARVKKNRKAPKPEREHNNATTGDVAEILEEKYHVMEIFWQLHGQEGADALTEGLVGQMENVLSGAPLTGDPFGEAESTIDHLFKKFLSEGEMDKLGYPGVPTQAALKGVNPRLKKKRGAPRPSFIASGLYEASAKCEVD